MDQKEDDEKMTETLVEPLAETKFKTTRYRWLILISFMLCIFNNAIAAMTLSTVAV